MLDVDARSLTDPRTLLASPDYAGIPRAYPRVAVFPGPRSGPAAVQESATAGSGQVFLVDYLLVDGCHACARVGSLRMAIAFDAEGRFAGSRVAAVRAANP
jgi:hypothetical protein